jgi:hypothetical protein
LQLLATCLCLLSPAFALATAATTGLKAYRKGYSGVMFAFVLVVGSAFAAGIGVGLVGPLTANPTASKDDLGAGIILGAVAGGAFGMLLMGLVSRLLPDKFARDADAEPLDE